jgi:hypothetical protein
MGVVIDSPELGDTMATNFDDQIDESAYRLELSGDRQEQARLHWIAAAEGAEQRFSSEPETSWWQRLQVRLLSFVVIESWL